MSSVFVSNVAASTGAFFPPMSSDAAAKAEGAQDKPAGWVNPGFKTPRCFEAETEAKPYRSPEFQMVLTPIRATMIRFNLAIGPDEIMFPGLEATSSPYDWINTPVPLPEPLQPCPMDVCA